MRTLILAALLAMISLSACATAKMTLSDFRFRCRFADSGGGMEDDVSSCNFQTQQHLCNAYANVLNQSYLNRDECIQACGAVQREFTLQTRTTGCQSFALRSKTICQQYCRQHFD